MDVTNALKRLRDDLKEWTTNNILTLKTYVDKTRFSGSYKDLTDKPNIPSIEGLATEEYVDNTYLPLTGGLVTGNVQIDGNLVNNNNATFNKQVTFNDIATLGAGANLAGNEVQINANTLVNNAVSTHNQAATFNNTVIFNEQATFSKDLNVAGNVNVTAETGDAWFNGNVSVGADNKQLATEEFVNNMLSGLRLVQMTQSEYDALDVKDSNTLYIIVN